MLMLNVAVKFFIPFSNTVALLQPFPPKYDAITPNRLNTLNTHIDHDCCHTITSSGALKDSEEAVDSDWTDVGLKNGGE